MATRRLSSGLLTFVVVALALCAPAAPAHAHAVLQETQPVSDAIVEVSPERASVTFNEAVEIAFGALRVYDTDGERVDSGDSSHSSGDHRTVAVSLEPDLPDGTYTVTYRVISGDGHPVEAAFVFHVGRPGERPQGIGETLLSGGGGSGPIEQALYGVARWVLFAGIALLVGAFSFLVFVWARSRSLLERDHETDQRFVTRWRRLAVAGWWTTLGATLAGFVLQGAVAADVSAWRALSPSVGLELLETRYGGVALVRLVVLVVLAGVWAAGTRTSTARSLWPLRRTSTAGAEAAASSIPVWASAASACLLALLAATPGLSGHAGATDPVWLNIPVDTLHVAFAGVWIGGLVILVWGAYRAAPTEASARLRTLAPVVSRFSDIALVSVGILVATGAYRTWVEVQALRAFVDAPYGWVLLTKLGVFLPLLALGAINNRVLKPRVDRAVSADADGDSALRTLHRVTSAEIALGVVVLAVTALLVNLSPARVEAGISGPFVAEVALGANDLEIVVDPNEIGENLVHLTVTTPAGAPAEIQAMKVRFVMPEQDIGPLTGAGKELGPGHFVVQGNQLSVAGEWILEIEARIDKFTNEQARARVTVNR
jgi:copper transport protein